MQDYSNIPPDVGEYGPPRPMFASKENLLISGFSDVKTLNPYGTVDLHAGHAGKNLYYELFKRGMDVFVSILMILISLPLTILLALLIKVTSRGPVIYKQRRLGEFGRPFDCWKFRTMVSDADEILQRNPQLLKQFDEKFKIDNDPRITRIGCFLRCTSLDELPQLVQVLEGRMSLIGPRPIIGRELEKYSIYADKLLSIKPGLSGLWQTSGRSDTTYSERVSLDMQYIDNRSTLLDLKLLLRTVVTVIRKTGAC